MGTGKRVANGFCELCDWQEAADGIDGLEKKSSIPPCFDQHLIPCGFYLVTQRAQPTTRQEDILNLFQITVSCFLVAQDHDEHPARFMDGTA